MKKHKPYSEDKVWGSVRIARQSEDVLVTHLKMKRGYSCSHHRHRFRANRFFLLSGSVEIQEFADEYTSLEIQGSPTYRNAQDWDSSRPPEWECEFNQTGSVIINTCEYVDVPSGSLHRFVCIEDSELIEIYWADRPEGVVLHDDIVRLTTGCSLLSKDESS